MYICQQYEHDISHGKKKLTQINEKLHNAYETVAEQSTTNAAKETAIALGCDPNNTTDCQVSVDGTWQRRGYSSLNGVVTLISRGWKMCRFSGLSKKCKNCEIWSKRKDNDSYFEWKTSHQCKINHTKSAGSMESASACTLFQRSVEKNKLRYTSYIGDIIFFRC